RFLEDNDIVAQQVTRTITSPAFGWLPTLSRSTIRSSNRRPQVAKAIERALGQIAVTRFNAPGPIKYAKGTSNVVFGEFKTWQVAPERQPAVIFTAVDYNRKDPRSVAVCLYGSMDNFPEYIQSAGPGSEGGPLGEGWVSSSAPAVYNFIRSNGKQLDDPYCDPNDMAIEALRIADGQGLSSLFTGGDDSGLGINQPWQRTFTYGDAAKAQWLAQIYLDVDLFATGNARENGFRRILVGVPLWIRTPDPRAITLYATSDHPEVIEARQILDRKKPAPPSRLVNVDTSCISPTKGLSDDESEQDILATPTITIPYKVYTTLRASFVKGAADWVMRRVNGRTADNRIPHLGDN